MSPILSCRLLCRGANKAETERLKIRDLLTKICFFNSRIGGEVLRGSFHDDAASLQDVGAIGMFQGGVRVLLNQQDGCPLTLNFINRFEDRMDDERRQT